MLGANTTNASTAVEVEDTHDPDYVYAPSRNVRYVNPRSRVHRPEIQDPSGVPRPTESQREPRRTRRQDPLNSTPPMTTATSSAAPATGFLSASNRNR